MPEARLRGFLALAGAGAVVVLVDLLGLVGSLAGAGAMALGLILSAPAAPAPGPDRLNWWALLAAGLGLVAVGVPLGLVWSTPGGLLDAAGAALVVIAVALGWP